MSSSRTRRPLALAAAVAIGATIALSGSGVAAASHAGDGTGRLTAAFGDLYFPDGHSMYWISSIDYAAWSPDGSRFAFVNGDGTIMTIRDDETDDPQPVPMLVVPAKTGITRSHPSWRGSNGFGLAWAEEGTDGVSRIMIGSSTPYCCTSTSTSFGSRQSEQVSPQDGFDYTHPDAADNNLVVFQRTPVGGGTSSVWVYDPQADPKTRQVVADAEQPSISPDGKRVAFVRQVGDSRPVFTTNLTGENLLQITDNTGVNGIEVHRNPTWSPDGQTIAVNHQFGYQISTVPADGSRTETIVQAPAGVPAYQPFKQNTVQRLAGSSRFGTAGAVSQSLWKTAGDGNDTRLPAQSVVLSRSDNFADALGGATLAAAKQGPLLLTSPTSLNPTTAAEIDRVLDPGATVWVLGGTGAVSAAVQATIEAKGYHVERITGANRYETSANIANAVVGDPNKSADYVLVATGANFPDALAAGAAAGSYNVPGTGMSAVILLTQDAKLPAATQNYLDKWVGQHPGDGPWAIGGQAAKAIAGYDRYELIGSNRYMTSLAVAHYFFGGHRVAGVATGTNWPDALAGGALLATLNGPLLITPGNAATLDANPSFGLDGASGSISTAYVFGGTGAVNTALEGQIGTLISGPAGYQVITITESGGLVGGATLRSTAGSTPRSADTTGTGLKTVKPSAELHPAQR